MSRVAVFKPWQWVAVAVLLCLSLSARSGPLTLTPDINSVTLDVGGSYTVWGKITNITGAALNTTDLFLSFSGYPDLALSLSQVLGDPDLLLPDRATSASLALFTVVALPGALAGASYGFDFFAQDINGVFSDDSAFTVRINAANGDPTVPEPASLLMGLTALAAAFVAKPLSRRRPAPSGLHTHPQQS